MTKRLTRQTLIPGTGIAGFTPKPRLCRTGVVIKGTSEQIHASGRARIRDGVQGAKRSDTRRYREHLQRSKPPETGMRQPRWICSAVPKVFSYG